MILNTQHAHDHIHTHDVHAAPQHNMSEPRAHMYTQYTHDVQAAPQHIMLARKQLPFVCMYCTSQNVVTEIFYKTLAK